MWRGLSAFGGYTLRAALSPFGSIRAASMIFLPGTSAVSFYSNVYKLYKPKRGVDGRFLVVLILVVLRILQRIFSEFRIFVKYRHFF